MTSDPLFVLIWDFFYKTAKAPGHRAFYLQKRNEALHEWVEGLEQSMKLWRMLSSQKVSVSGRAFSLPLSFSASSGDTE